MTVPRRDAVTLQAVIASNVNQGSTVHTDFWRGYNFIHDWHRSVNHSEGFITEDGIHTNTIEGKFNLLSFKLVINLLIRNLECH